MIPDPVQKAKVIGAFLGPYGNVTPPPLSALQSIKPSTVHVVVQNGSGVPGLAGVVSAKLEKLHYVVDSVGNADTFGYDVTQIRPVTALPFLGERVRADLGVPAAAIAPATDTTPGPHTARHGDRRQGLRRGERGRRADLVRRARALTACRAAA